MEVESLTLAGIAGKISGLYKFLESHPNELGVNNFTFRKTLAECDKELCDMLRIKSDLKINVNKTASKFF